MKKAVLSVFGIYVAGALLIALAVFTLGRTSEEPVDPDNYVRDRTLLLHSTLGSCSSVEILSPKTGKAYVLSAGHCAVLSFEGRVLATNEAGEETFLTVLDVDHNKDLMLLSSPNGKGLRLADKEYVHQKVHTITWGHGMPPYRTDGEIIYPEMQFEIPSRPIESILDLIDNPMMKVFRTITTAAVIPGSSGGAMMNAANELIGIVSAMYVGTPFTVEVPLDEIKIFLGER